MRYFVYVGDRLETYPFGMTFRAGEPTPVEDKSVIKKLLGNSHFKEVIPEGKASIEQRTLTLKK